MRPGGSKEKGSEFERQTGTLLSLWITQGGRADLFARNVLSGGQFTNALKRGSTELGTPGDLVANNPLAFAFLSMFFIECKHYKDLGFEALLFDEGKSFLGQVLAGCRKQAKQAPQLMFPLVIARQNRRPTIMLCDGAVGHAFLRAVPRRRPAPRWHSLHDGSIMMMPFEAALSVVSAEAFINEVAALRGDVKELPHAAHG